MTRALAAIALCACGPSGETYFDAACAPAVLYLNRTGATYQYGPFDDASTNYSPLIGEGTRDLPPWPHDNIDWASLRDCITLGLAPFPVTITETDPGATQHSELVFTTAYWAGPAGTTFITSGGCNTTEVSFLFGNALPTYSRACHLAVRTYAQMTAQLDLADDCEDFMNNSQDCSEMRMFKDAPAACVDNAMTPTDCRCGGTTQNSYRALLAATTCN